MTSQMRFHYPFGELEQAMGSNLSPPWPEPPLAHNFS